MRWRYLARFDVHRAGLWQCVICCGVAFVLAALVLAFEVKPKPN